MKEGDWDQKFAEVLASKDKRNKDKDTAKQAEKDKEAKKDEEKPAEGEIAGTKAEEGTEPNESTPKENPEGKAFEDESTDEEERVAVQEQIQEIEQTLAQTPTTQGAQKKASKKKKNKNKRHNDKKKRKNPGSVPSGPSGSEPRRSDAEEKEEKKREIYDDTILDEVDFPIPFKNPELATNWFDFNDSSVTAIPVNRIQTQFGGNSSENAYILLYRQKSLAKGPDYKRLELQSYLKKSIVATNEAYENEIQAYKEAESQLEVIILDLKNINVLLLSL